MNEMAMVEYLLRLYAKYMKGYLKAIVKEFVVEGGYYDSKVALISKILSERFGMKIRETDDEYIAENSVCSVRVKKE